MKDEIIAELRARGEDWVRKQFNNLLPEVQRVAGEWLAECETARARQHRESEAAAKQVEADKLEELRGIRTKAQEAIILAKEATRTSLFAKWLSWLATFLSILATILALYPRLAELLHQLM